MNAQLVSFLQLTLNGVAIGSIYALVALGIVLTYKATEVLNFAYGDILMMSAFIGWGLIAVAGLPFWLAVLADHRDRRACSAICLTGTSCGSSSGSRNSPASC